MRASRALRRCSVRRSSTALRNTSTMPIMTPAPSRIGAAESSIDRSVPSLAIRNVWLARPTTRPSRRTLSTGFSTGRPVPSSKMRKTVGQWLSLCIVLRPAGQFFGNGVQKGHPPFDVRGDDGVANARQRYPQPLALVTHAALRPVVAAGPWPSGSRRRQAAIGRARSGNRPCESRRRGPRVSEPMPKRTTAT